MKAGGCRSSRWREKWNELTQPWVPPQSRLTALQPGLSRCARQAPQWKESPNIPQTEQHSSQTARLLQRPDTSPAAWGLRSLALKACVPCPPPDSPERLPTRTWRDWLEGPEPLPTLRAQTLTGGYWTDPAQGRALTLALKRIPVAFRIRPYSSLLPSSAPFPNGVWPCKPGSRGTCQQATALLRERTSSSFLLVL